MTPGRCCGVTDDSLVVDFARLPTVGTDTAVERQHQATAFGRTVQSVLGSMRPVQVTLAGEPAALMGESVLDSGATELTVQQRAAPFPQPVRTGRIDVVGRVEDPQTTVRYPVARVVDEVDRFQGTAPAVAGTTGVYAFSLEVPAGRYLLTIDTRGLGRRPERDGGGGVGLLRRRGLAPPPATDPGGGGGVR